MKPLFFCLIASLAIPVAALAQSPYRWVDKDGRVHYSDQPPPSSIKKVEPPRLGTNTIETIGLPFEPRKAAQDHLVALYSSADCKSECQGARDFLKRRGIPFREITIANAGDADAYRATFGGEKLSVPALTVGSQKQQGFEEGMWSGLLDNAGYTRGAGPVPAANGSPYAPAAR